MKRNSSGVNVGTASLVMIFSVVCLTILSVLTLTSALSERRLAERAASAAEAYYEAESRCFQTLARLRGGEMPENLSGCEVNGRSCLAFSEEIDQRRTLRAVVSADAPYEVLVWRVTENGSWQPDEYIDVFGS